MPNRRKPTRKTKSTRSEIQLYDPQSHLDLTALNQSHAGFETVKITIGISQLIALIVLALTCYVWLDDIGDNVKLNKGNIEAVLASGEKARQDLKDNVNSNLQAASDKIEQNADAIRDLTANVNALLQNAVGTKTELNYLRDDINANKRTLENIRDSP